MILLREVWMLINVWFLLNWATYCAIQDSFFIDIDTFILEYNILYFQEHIVIYGWLQSIKVISILKYSITTIFGYYLLQDK